MVRETTVAEGAKGWRNTTIIGGVLEKECNKLYARKQ